MCACVCMRACVCVCVMISYIVVRIVTSLTCHPSIGAGTDALKSRISLDECAAAAVVTRVGLTRSSPSATYNILFEHLENY